MSFISAPTPSQKLETNRTDAVKKNVEVNFLEMQRYYWPPGFRNKKYKIVKRRADGIQMWTGAVFRSDSFRRWCVKPSFSIWRKLTPLPTTTAFPYAPIHRTGRSSFFPQHSLESLCYLQMVGEGEFREKDPRGIGSTTKHIFLYCRHLSGMPFFTATSSEWSGTLFSVLPKDTGLLRRSKLWPAFETFTLKR